MAATLVAVDSVIIPVRPTDTDFQTLAKFTETIEQAKELNPKLQIKTLLFNQVNMAAKSKDIFKSLLNGHPLESKVSKSMIRIANSVGLSSGQGKDIFEFDPKSKVAQDYKLLAQEVLSWA
jgi:cellulose biosynthesis protein BcsQ